MFTIDDKEPSLFDYDGNLKKFWYVGFRMTNPNNPAERKAFQIRGFINYKKKVSERRKVGKGLVLAVKDALEKGWNPFELSFEDWIKSSLKLAVKPKKMGFIDGLRHGLKRKKKTLSSKTYGEYENNINYAETAAKKLGIHNKPVDQIKRGDIRRVLAQIQEDRNWTEHAYNKGLKCLSSPMRELLQDDIIEYNPCSMIDRQHWAEVNCFEPPTDKELKIIKETLIEKNLPYYIYILFGYHTGMRPKEIFGLQIKNLNFEDRSFKLIPGDGRTKTKKTRIVPINKHLWKYIEKMRLKNFPPEYYIFSDNFLPGAKRKHRNYSTNEWKRLIIDGQGIDKKQYGMKSRGADDKILAGVPLDALKELYGHSSKMMTEKYARKVKEVYRKEILDKSPDL